MTVNFLTNDVWVLLLNQSLGKPLLSVVSNFFAHYMTIYLNSVQINVMACTIENLDFSEFLDAQRACCRHKIECHGQVGMQLSPPLNQPVRILYIKTQRGEGALKTQRQQFGQLSIL